jgi:hypothetical protein
MRMPTEGLMADVFEKYLRDSGDNVSGDRKGVSYIVGLESERHPVSSFNFLGYSTGYANPLHGIVMFRHLCQTCQTWNDEELYCVQVDDSGRPLVWQQWSSGFLKELFDVHCEDVGRGMLRRIVDDSVEGMGVGKAQVKRDEDLKGSCAAGVFDFRVADFSFKDWLLWELYGKD